MDGSKKRDCSFKTESCGRGGNRGASHTDREKVESLTIRFVLLLVQTGKDLTQFIFPPSLVLFEFILADQGDGFTLRADNSHPLVPSGHYIMRRLHPTVGTRENLA